MFILGINQIPLFSVSHDTSAAIVADGKVIAAAEEERFNRIKHTSGAPEGAIKCCLDAAGISIGDFDLIVLANNPYRLFANLYRDFHYSTLIHKVARFVEAKRCRYQMQKRTRVPVNYVGHHLAHAASGYYLSGFDEANILTIDGSGESESFTFYVGRGSKITRIWNIPLGWRYSNSIGAVYSQITHELGLGRFGEGKTMGLASYGEATVDLSGCFSIKGHLDYKLNRGKLAALHRELVRSKEEQPFSRAQKNLAASVQSALEQGVVNLAREAWQQSGLRKFVLAGGVALNCNLNSKLLNQDFCDELFVPPVANDTGLALGSALYAMHTQTGMTPKRLVTPYLGPKFDDQEIESLLSRENLRWARHADIAYEAAIAICSGKIIGWFQGRLEIGPRALGNRSILADPTSSGINDRVNIKVKRRAPWRPFGPAVIQECASRYFHGFEKMTESPYMLHTVSVREEFKEAFPAITHVDGSTRPQTVDQKQNQLFYALLKEIEKINGHPLVLNTSFNVDSEPIVCSPQDALRCFYTSGLDLLVIGNFIISR